MLVKAGEKRAPVMIMMRRVFLLAGRHKEGGVESEVYTSLQIRLILE